MCASARYEITSFNPKIGESLKVSLKRALLEGKNWGQDQVAIGTSFVFMSEKVWYEMEYILKENRRLMGNGSDNASVMSTPSMFSGSGNDDVSDNESRFSDDFVSRGIPSIDIELGTVNHGKADLKKVVEPAAKPRTARRKQWLCFVWGVSWWIPSLFLSLCGRMKRKDQQIAWREKVALCVIILFLNLFIIFVIAGLGWILCPPLDVLSPGEIQESSSLNSGSLIHMVSSNVVLLIFSMGVITMSLMK